MDGIHDMGGLEGFGPVPYEPGQPSSHEPWEYRARVVTRLVSGGLGLNTDQFRHTLERLPPDEYLSGYYSRWIRGAQKMLAEHAGKADTPADGTARRESDRAPRFATGDRVRTHDRRTSGHTRLPGYARGRQGEVAIVHPNFVFPDTNAHGVGENPQPVYAVRFEATELWGPDADGAAATYIDLFEDYLEPAND